VENACASAGVAFHEAVQSIRFGRYSNALAIGVEKMTGRDGKTITDAISCAGDRQHDVAEGLTFPASYAIIAASHMEKYGTKHEVLEKISLKNHNNANLNSNAHFFHKKVTIEEVKSAQMVAKPLTLLDCSPISDGAAAAVISASKNGTAPIEVLGCAMASDTISLAEREDITSFKAAKLAAKKAYDQAGKRPEEISLAQVHDCFTIAELIAVEDLGFYEPGKAAKGILAGETDISGMLPVNTDGGLKADGHPIGASGLAQIFEAATQLRKTAGHRQIKQADTALCHNIGGVGGTAVVSILGQ
jgi:acetyl-CoA C-acetyltransferase